MQHYFGSATSVKERSVWPSMVMPLSSWGSRPQSREITLPSSCCCAAVRTAELFNAFNQNQHNNLRGRNNNFRPRCVESNELAQPEVASVGAGFVGDAFLTRVCRLHVQGSNSDSDEDCRE